MNGRRAARVAMGVLLVPGGIAAMVLGLAAGNVAAAGAAIYGGPLASLTGIALMVGTGVPSAS